MKQIHSNIDDQILKSTLPYQYVGCKHLLEIIPIKKKISKIITKEIGLIGPGNSCLTRFLEITLGRYKSFHIHSCLYDSYGRFYRKHGLGRGYCYAPNRRLTAGCLKNSPLFGHVSGFTWILKNSLHI